LIFTPVTVNSATASFPIKDTEAIKLQLLNWANRFNSCCFLDNHRYASSYQELECIAAAGVHSSFTSTTDTLNDLAAYLAGRKHRVFGHIGYDLKNELEGMQSGHEDRVGFPVAYFFEPEHLLQLKNGELLISSVSREPKDIYEELISTSDQVLENSGEPVSIQPRISKTAYIDSIQKIQEHIHRGDCYELNFCQEFFATDAVIDPVQVYRRLTGISPNPFSCFYKLEDKYLLCASPERYLQKKGSRILSQPIKGTARRDAMPAVDERLRNELRNSGKDRSENVMVVDLVRNDLSKVCTEGSVQTDELFGIYSFPQVHQMISTISGQLKPGVSFTDILKASFPMGSMTGAPKRRVMQLIEQYEKTKRGIYSGAVGYIDPQGDFDFNVVIRSILYNATDRYLSYQVGGGITAYSEAEKEYEECLLKAAAISQVLTAK
jgi:para-aminobenzoate synthetase component 1